LKRLEGEKGRLEPDGVGYCSYVQSTDHKTDIAVLSCPVLSELFSVSLLLVLMQPCHNLHPPPQIAHPDLLI
jgi:hypothetical protein